MGDAREALVALICSAGEVGDELTFECDCDNCAKVAGRIADVIQAAGWTPPGERCEHGGELRWKFDGGRGAMLCEKCDAIVGYITPKPTVKPSVEDVARIIGKRWNMSPRNKDVLDDARAVFALFPGRAEAEVKAEALREAADVFTNADVLTTEEQREFAAWLMVRANSMSGEEVRWRPAPAAPDSADVRERMARAIHDATEGHAALAVGCDTIPWSEASADARGEAFAAADAVLAVVGQGVTMEAVADLVDWLADCREEYTGGPPDMDRVIRQEANAARVIAKALRNPDEAGGWLPSWRWDEYAERHSAAVRPSGQEGDAPSEPASDSAELPFAFTDEEWAEYQRLPGQNLSRRHWLERAVNALADAWVEGVVAEREYEKRMALYLSPLGDGVAPKPPVNPYRRARQKHDLSLAPHHPGPGKWCEACPTPEPDSAEQGEL